MRGVSSFGVIVLCGALALTGCRVETNAKVNMRANGSGTVAVDMQLDREAASAVPNLEDSLQVSDLTKAGWNVDVDEDSGDGGARIHASHGFDNPEQGAALLTQLTGADGPFKNVKLTQDRSFTKVTSGFTGTIDLLDGIKAFGDDGLVNQSGYELGFDADEAASSLNIDWAQTFPVTFSVNLPGDDENVQPAPASDGSWTLTFGETTAVNVSSAGTNIWPVTFASLAGAALFGALGVLVFWRSGVYKARHRKRIGRRSGVRARDLLQAGGHTA